MEYKAAEPESETVMFIKIVSLKKSDKDSYIVDRVRVIDCDEYEKIWFEVNGEYKKLVLKIFVNKVLNREILFDDPERRVDIFIENNNGQTVDRIEYPANR